MSEFIKYQHIEKLGSDEVEGILNGTVYIQSKLDGCNSVLYLGKDGLVHAGSRKREISIADDNHGFAKDIAVQDKYKKFFEKYPNLILYGEFLIKNHIKNYAPTAYREFYVFDITNDNGEGYIRWDMFHEFLDPFDIKYIPVIATLDNPTKEEIESYLDKGRFCCMDETIQEGIVIKNIDFINKYGRTTWAKLLTNEYKVAKHNKNSIHNECVEVQIIDKFLTADFITKEYHKILNEVGEWNSKYIGRLLSTLWYEFINEESWHIIKTFHNPTINYKTLQGLVTDKIKDTLTEVF